RWAATADDHQATAPGQRGTPRAPAQEARRLLDRDHVRPGRADDPGHGRLVVAQRADVVGEQAHYTRRRARSAAPTRPASGPRRASLTSAAGRNPRPVSECRNVSRAGTISRSPASD